MTDVNRSNRMPRGRQTIRKSGSLLGFHGPVSRRIKLWTADAKSDPILAALERAYFTALDVVDRLEDRNQTYAANGRLTQEGMKADAFQFARNHLLPALDRGRETISRAKAEVVARRAKPKHQHVDEISELEEAIAAAESAVDAAYEEVRIEAGGYNHSAQ
jgi:hypothetical protein